MPDDGRAHDRVHSVRLQQRRRATRGATVGSAPLAVVGDGEPDRLAVEATRRIDLVDRDLHRRGERLRDRRELAGQRRELAENERAVDVAPGRSGGRRVDDDVELPPALSSPLPPPHAASEDGERDEANEHAPGGGHPSRVTTPRPDADRVRDSDASRTGSPVPEIFKNRTLLVPKRQRGRSARGGSLTFPVHRHRRRAARRVIAAVWPPPRLSVAALAVGGAPAGAWPGDPDGSFGSCGLRSGSTSRRARPVRRRASSSTATATSSVDRSAPARSSRASRATARSTRRTAPVGSARSWSVTTRR